MAYRVTMDYFDGDHDHGHYESPLFATKEDAESFKAAVLALPVGHIKRWTTCSDWAEVNLAEDMVVAEVPVVEWTGTIGSAANYLHVSYT